MAVSVITSTDELDQIAPQWDALWRRSPQARKEQTEWAV